MKVCLDVMIIHGIYVDKTIRQYVQIFNAYETQPLHTLNTDIPGDQYSSPPSPYLSQSDRIKNDIPSPTKTMTASLPYENKGAQTRDFYDVSRYYHQIYMYSQVNFIILWSELLTL